MLWVQKINKLWVQKKMMWVQKKKCCGCKKKMLCVKKQKLKCCGCKKNVVGAKTKKLLWVKKKNAGAKKLLWVKKQKKCGEKKKGKLLLVQKKENIVLGAKKMKRECKKSVLIRINQNNICRRVHKQQKRKNDVQKNALLWVEVFTGPLERVQVQTSYGSGSVLAASGLG